MQHESKESVNKKLFVCLIQKKKKEGEKESKKETANRLTHVHVYVLVYTSSEGGLFSFLLHEMSGQDSHVVLTSFRIPGKMMRKATNNVVKQM